MHTTRNQAHVLWSATLQASAVTKPGTHSQSSPTCRIRLVFAAGYEQCPCHQHKRNTAAYAHNTLDVKQLLLSFLLLHACLQDQQYNLFSRLPANLLGLGHKHGWEKGQVLQSVLSGLLAGDGSAWNSPRKRLATQGSHNRKFTKKSHSTLYFTIAAKYSILRGFVLFIMPECSDHGSWSYCTSMPGNVWRKRCCCEYCQGRADAHLDSECPNERLMGVVSLSIIFIVCIPLIP